MNPRIFQWHIWLVDSDPPIWRRFQVEEHITLDNFHGIIQAVMGWQNSHLYAFDISQVRYGVAELLEGAESSLAVTLADLNLKPGAQFTYTYDFGDGWLHLLALEEILSPSDTPLPYCLAGERACPLEDSGGIWGYEDLIDRLDDTDDPDYLELLDWFGNFDPETFEVGVVNQRLQALS